MEDILISIVIPTYNHGHFLRRCLDSIMGQTHKNWEVIVVNNFSKDNTIEIVSSYNHPQVKLINFNNNGIIAASRNVGIKESCGDYIAFLDSDDYWYPEKLAECIKHLDGNDIIYHDLQPFGPNGEIKNKRVKGRSLEAPAWKDILIKGNEPPTSSAIVRKSALIEVGYFREDKKLFAIEDMDLWVRLAKQGFKFHYIERVFGGYWMGGKNCSKPTLESISRMEYLYNEHTRGLNDFESKKAKGTLSYICARQRFKRGESSFFVINHFFNAIYWSSRWDFKFRSIACLIQLAFLVPSNMRK